MSNLDSCPNCKANWLSDEIPDGLIKTGHYRSREDAEKAAALYGWTSENKKCFKLEIGISDMIKDCIVAYECPICKFQVEKN